MLKTLSVTLFIFLSGFFGHIGKWVDKKAKIKFKMYDVTDLTANNYNTRRVTRFFSGQGSFLGIRALR